jgi:hypothetical protein
MEQPSSRLRRHRGVVRADEAPKTDVVVITDEGTYTLDVLVTCASLATRDRSQIPMR